jgi:hypothetical protein
MIREELTETTITAVTCPELERLRMSAMVSDCRWLLVLESISDLLATVGLAGIVGSLSGAAVNWYFEGRKFKREQRIAHLKDRLDNFYSPLIFHFENMKSWGVFLKKPYAYSSDTLAAKIGDMNSIMRSGMRLVGPKVQVLWYEWQPWAVAAVEKRRRGRVYPQFEDEEFLIRSQRLHDALKADCEELLRQYKSEIGTSNEPV